MDKEVIKVLSEIATVLNHHEDLIMELNEKVDKMITIDITKGEE